MSKKKSSLGYITGTVPNQELRKIFPRTIFIGQQFGVLSKKKNLNLDFYFLIVYN